LNIARGSESEREESAALDLPEMRSSIRGPQYLAVVRRWVMKEEQSFKPGDVVEIIHGPFAKVTGKVRDVNDDKRMLLIIVEIFGRDTPVELTFREVKKIAS
jgi:transcription antitermination factor NusG